MVATVKERYIEDLSLVGARASWCGRVKVSSRDANFFRVVSSLLCEVFRTGRERLGLVLGPTFFSELQVL
jgi:hypothetical protein